MDPRIKQLIVQTGFPFNFDENVGSWGVDFRLGDRSQVVWVDASPDQMGPYTDFTIWSPVCDRPSGQQVLTALRAVGTGKLGGFLLRDYTGAAPGSELIYSVDIAPDSTADTFREALRICVMSADAAERALGLDKV
jgi:hypothetical protein